MKKIYYQFVFDQEESTLLLLNDLILNGVFRIHIKELPAQLSPSFLQGLAESKSKGLELILSYSPELVQQLKPYSVLVENDPVLMYQLKRDRPELIVCMAAHSIVECKNGELAGANELFVDLQKFRASSLQPKGLLGQEAIENFYPAKEEYGWVFLTLNTDLIVGGITSIHQMKQLFAHTDFTSVILDERFESTLSLHEKIHAVQAILL